MDPNLHYIQKEWLISNNFFSKLQIQNINNLISSIQVEEQGLIVTNLLCHYYLKNWPFNFVAKNEKYLKGIQGGIK